MSLARYAQTARNSLQATRINAISQVRGMFGGGLLSLQDNEGNNNTPPTEGFKGPFGMWTFPVLSKFMGGAGGFGFMPSTTPAQTRMGVPSNVASQAGTRGVQSDIRDPAYGIHIF